MKAPLDSPVMEGFVTRLEEINALADHSPGFVWRLQTPEGDATYLRPYADDRILVNLSVWQTVESLKHYVYGTAHAESFGVVARGSRILSALTWQCGGCQPATHRVSTKQRSGSRISRATGRRNSRSHSRPCSRRTRVFSRPSIGPCFRPVRPRNARRAAATQILQQICRTTFVLYNNIVVRCGSRLEP